MAKLTQEFYSGDTVSIARALLGCYLVRRCAGENLVCRITETEAYIGRMDKACHAYNYHRTPRTSTMFLPGGCAYVYFTYGMHHCLNLVTEPAGEPSAVLIRAVKPITPLDTISRLRFGVPCCEQSAYQRKNFMNGPGKVCKGLSLTRADDRTDLTGQDLFVVTSLSDVGLAEETFSHTMHTGTRIGIGYAEEAVDFPWRFWI